MKAMIQLTTGFRFYPLACAIEYIPRRSRIAMTLYAQEGGWYQPTVCWSRMETPLSQPDRYQKLRSFLFETHILRGVINAGLSCTWLPPSCTGAWAAASPGRGTYVMPRPVPSTRLPTVLIPVQLAEVCMDISWLLVGLREVPVAQAHMLYRCGLCESKNSETLTVPTTTGNYVFNSDCTSAFNT